MSTEEKITEPWDTLIFISVEDEELTKETERAATKERNQDSVMSWKSSGKKNQVKKEGVIN